MTISKMAIQKMVNSRIEIQKQIIPRMAIQKQVIPRIGSPGNGISEIDVNFRNLSGVQKVTINV